MKQNGYSGVLPHLVARQDEGLIPLGDGKFESKLDLFLLYHETRRNDPVIRAGVDWISDTLSQPDFV